MKPLQNRNPLALFATALVLSLASITASLAQNDPGREDWIQLFNGRDLNDWVVKIRGHEAGVNFANTFRVEGGVMKVSYDQYNPPFAERFGHIFYKQPFSHYRLRIEYRFVGEQATGAPEWARRNSGVMVHSQDPKTMPAGQDFPISIEVQFLGGLSNGATRTTGNLCTPGTNVVYAGKLDTRHCFNSTSATLDGDQWVTAEVIVRGNGTITHIINGKPVIEYTEPQIGGGSVSGHRPEVKQDGKALSEGFISLQSESHPVEFRKVELLQLKGCMNPAASNFKRYYVEPDPMACR